MKLVQLTLSKLGFERNNQTLFKEINCTLESGELLQIRGTNGSGKSTLLRIIAGFLEPQAGNVLWQGHPISRQRNTYQENLHYIGHQNGIKPSLTVEENLQLSCALAAINSIPQELKKITEKIGLKRFLQKQAMHLSAGQTRRLSLARLLLNTNPIWILDEPTTALDAEGQKLLADLLNEHLAVGGIAIVATHQPLQLQQPMKMIWLGENNG